ncbi:MAG: hypothetical protein QOF35_1151, partial [Actinomycetota bacterium]|nr:hypothetical protein [Actinomycetota bacterium]
PATWQGATRAALRNQDVVPHLEDGHRLASWVGVGGSPQSVIRAARLGLALMLAIIGGPPARFAPFAALFHQALAKYGRSPQQRHIAVTRGATGLRRPTSCASGP